MTDRDKFKSPAEGATVSRGNGEQVKKACPGGEITGLYGNGNSVWCGWAVNVPVCRRCSFKHPPAIAAAIRKMMREGTLP